MQRFCKEFVTWKALRHQNVLPLLGVIMTGTQSAMVSEWMTNGNINQFVTTHQDANRFELVRFRSGSILACSWRLWLEQLGGVARGLVYMHDQGMVHGDLKGVCIRESALFSTF